ncbi:DUF1330 domain-containing protein [Xanthobacter aminoxidans]|uniref:DUF1330 domain-containing protein n=1 Tax=Xanthobacter aminoxidans TaxID=186280 RepID=UPI002022FF5A|nr:DUF1330 domain-containing protein [Xanthobacter aminoxidans]MCL8385415.1 DUF1330 domain-containing protein [Xanthobacter aminoxidans]
MKAYVISSIDVQDAERYAEYAALAPQTVVAFGGRYLARNGLKHPLEEQVPDSRVVLMEFPSVQHAKAWHASPAYQAIIGIRHNASTGSMFIIEGCDPPEAT